MAERMERRMEKGSDRASARPARTAVRAKDVASFVALYANDVRVFDMWECWSYDGAEAWRAVAGEPPPSTAKARHPSACVSARWSASP